MNGSTVLVLATIGWCLAGCADGVVSNGQYPQASPRPLLRQGTPPPGWKAINALGIGLFVPAGWRVDGRCTDEVTTPLGVERMPPGASCPAPAHSQLVLSALGLDEDGRCVTPRIEFRLGPERPCLKQHGAGHFGVTLGRERDLVGFDLNWTTQAEAVRILRTAQAVDLDNHGCASRYAPSATGSRLTHNDRTVTACVYRATEKRYPHRLWWSTELDTAAASAVLDRATASRPRPPPCLMAGAPPLIIDLDSSDGSVVTASIDECTQVTTVGSRQRARYLGPSDTARLHHLVTGAYR